MYREEKYAYTISNTKNPTNHPIYKIDDDMGNYVLSINNENEDNSSIWDIQKNVRSQL